MRVELTQEELSELLHVGEAALRDLRVEVRRTRTPDYHDALVVRRELLTQALEKLRGATAVEAG